MNKLFCALYIFQTDQHDQLLAADPVTLLADPVTSYRYEYVVAYVCCWLLDTLLTLL